MVYILYLWGSLTYEFSLIKNNDLFKLSIEPKQDDIQHLFPAWYDWVLSKCGTRDLTNKQYDDTNLLSVSTCHASSPYKMNQKWSLQSAMIYVGGDFIDKLITANNWSKLLDPLNTTLAKSTHQKWINYLIHDCLATTYLAKPVVDY
ncbi:unnamed protein product [Adineta steineri]|uniref:Uncharacterized protein n=1 Tax=Adineta steineri TaxID=433720 RepID=A0A819EYN2_9BILA|nr:unnamed protein product [Adineta steineri]CAF3858498.1 unnamed protein product [Adineta steineri]